MHIVHVVSDLDVSSGGPSRSVPALAEHEALNEGVKVSVLYHDSGNPVVVLPDSTVSYRVLGRAELLIGKFVQDEISSPASANQCVIHLHGLWSPMLHRAAVIARKLRVPYVVSIKGMLADWALQQKAFKKRVAWTLYQRTDLQNAAYLLASSELEHQDVSFHVSQSQVTIVPNGCEKRPERFEKYSLLPSGNSVRWALAIGRLHPVKGYADLIKAWARLVPKGWQLAIAGPDEDGYQAVLEELIAKNAMTNQVILLGEVSDSKKWSLLDQCELFVAPSKTENFGMAIAEALQSGTPVITTTSTPWRELHEYNCGWWVEAQVGALDQALSEATSSEVEVLKEMGARGHNLISEKYSWNQVAGSTIRLYRSILAGQNKSLCH